MSRSLWFRETQWCAVVLCLAVLHACGGQGSGPPGAAPQGSGGERTRGAGGTEGNGGAAGGGSGLGGGSSGVATGGVAAVHDAEARDSATENGPDTAVPAASDAGDDARSDARADGAGPGVSDPGSDGDGDQTIGPTYTMAPEFTVRPGVPTGTITNFTMISAESKIYPGIRGPYTRAVAVYVPKQYVPGTAAPFIVAQDGRLWTSRLAPLLDNMIHDRRLPVMVAIMIDNGGGDAQGSERGLEYDTVSARYTTFVETEVLPRVAREAKVELTTDPEGRATLGGSSGGAAAFTMGWFRPDLYRRILSYSGTFVNQQSPTDPMYPHGAWEYHEHLIPQSERKPLRVWLQVGDRDNGAGTPVDGLHNWVIANQRMAAALKAKGYHYQFVFCRNAGHVDKPALFQTLPAAMHWLWRGFPIQSQ